MSQNKITNTTTKTSIMKFSTDSSSDSDSSETKRCVDEIWANDCDSGMVDDKECEKEGCTSKHCCSVVSEEVVGNLRG